MQKTVVFILSPGHSGSTLLGHFLGAHERAMHLGEICTALNLGAPIKCYFCGETPCPVWGGIVPLPLLRRCWRGYRLSLRPRLRLMLPLGLWLGYCEPPGRLFDVVFAAFPRTDVLVDSSKSTGWAAWNARAGGYRTLFLLLIRDLRPLAVTYMRLFGQGIEQATRSVVQRLQIYRDFLAKQEPADCVQLRYEDLVSHPAEVGARLCERLGLDFEPSMLEYYRRPQHNFAGNPGPNAVVRLHHGGDPGPILARVDRANRDYYRLENLDTAFRLDERWRGHLSAEMEMQFRRIGGSLNRELGYDD
jgi:hypothetical protein